MGIFPKMGVFLGIFPNLTSFLGNNKIVTFIAGNKFGIISITVKSANFLQYFIFPKTGFQKTYMSQANRNILIFLKKGKFTYPPLPFPFSPIKFHFLPIQFLPLFFPILSHSFLMRFSSFRNFLTRYDENSHAFPILSMEYHRIFLLIVKVLLLIYEEILLK